MSGVTIPAGELAFLTSVVADATSLVLYVNNVTPAKSGTGSLTSDYTMAAGGGYAPITLSPGSWVLSGSNPTVAAYPIQTFTFTGPLTGNATIYGVAVKNGAGNILCAQLVASPFTPAVNGDTLQDTVSISLS